MWFFCSCLNNIFAKVIAFNQNIFVSVKLFSHCLLNEYSYMNSKKVFFLFLFFVLPTSFILNKLLKLKKNWSVTWVYGSNRQKTERVVFCLHLTTIVLLQTQHLLLEYTFLGFFLLGWWKQSAPHHPKICSFHPSWQNSPKGKPPSPH